LAPSLRHGTGIKITFVAKSESSREW
jgi:hypothetical protein